MKFIAPMVMVIAVLVPIRATIAEITSRSITTTEDPFAASLAEHPLLLELGGAEVFDRAKDGMAVIAVGRVMLADNSDERIESARRVALLKARAAAVGELNGIHVDCTRRFVETKVRSQDQRKQDTRIDRFHATHERIRGWLTGARSIGTWLSDDGKVLIVAIGIRVDGGNQLDSNR